MRYILIALSLLACSAFAADLSVQSVTGASAANLTGAVTIYGSLAGDSCSNKDATKTCNSCAAPVSCASAPFCSCSTRRIWDGMVLRINLQKSNKLEGNAVIHKVGNFQPLALVTPNNGGAFADVRWSDLCGLAGGMAGCASLGNLPQATIPLRVGIDEDGNGMLNDSEKSVDVTLKISLPGDAFNVFGTPGNSMEGISFFRVYAGNSMAVIGDVRAMSGFPFLSYGFAARHLRVFVSDQNMAMANPAQALTYVDLKISDDGRMISPANITGLINGRVYFFRIALVDEAGSVIQYFPDQTTLPQECVYGPLRYCPFVTMPRPF